MFGGKRRKAVSTATEAVSPFVRVLENTSGIPQGFWKDPYVVGFLTGCIAIFAKMGTGWKIGGEELGRALMEVLDSLSGGHGMEVVTLGNRFREAQDPEYARGFRNAEKAISVAYGLGDYTDDPDVQAARKEAQDPRAPINSANVSGSMGGKVGGALLDRLFYKEVQSRLG